MLGLELLDASAQFLDASSDGLLEGRVLRREVAVEGTGGHLRLLGQPIDADAAEALAPEAAPRRGDQPGPRLLPMSSLVSHVSFRSP